jgi:hypothetical protein
MRKYARWPQNGTFSQRLSGDTMTVSDGDKGSVSAQVTPGGGILQLVSGQATVTVSGAPPGCGPISGSGPIDLAPQGLFTLMPGHDYQIIAPFVGTEHVPVTEQCGTDPPTSFTEAPGAAAIQSGDPITGRPTALTQHSPDGHTFTGSASAAPSPGDSSNWTWSVTGAT